MALKNSIERKDLVIQEADKGSTVVITECTKWVEGIKSLLSDSSKYMQFATEEDKWVSYINNLQSKTIFRVLQKDEYEDNG